MVRSKRPRIEKAILLRCNVDGESMLASETEVQKSALISSFPAVPDTIDLPFSKAQAKAWLTINQGDPLILTKQGMRLMSFHECTEALKVRRCHLVVLLCHVRVRCRTVLAQVSVNAQNE